MKYLLRAGRFFRILDEQNDLSITNIAVIVILYRLWEVPTTSLQDTAMAMTVMLNYLGKKFAQKKDK